MTGFRPPPERLGLEVLFPTIGAAGFLSAYFPGRFCSDRSEGVMAWLAGSPLVEREAREVLADFSGDTVKLWKGGHSAAMDAKEAACAFDGGAVYIAQAERRHAYCAEFLAGLCAELGVSLRHASCSLFLSSAGATVPLHFDHDFGFNVLLRGRKRWTVAPNAHVPWPTVGFDASKPPLPELSRYLERPLPSVMPADALTVEAEPGTVCFLPRGLWHETFAYSECVALDFAVDPPVWADYIGALFRDAALLSPGGRESVLGAGGASAFGELYRRRRGALLRLLEELRREIEGEAWRAGERRGPAAEAGA